MEYVNGFLHKDSIILLYRNQTGVLCKKTIDPQSVSYHKVTDISGGVKSALGRSKYVKSMTVEGKWCRITWVDHEARKSAVAPDGYFKANGILSFEGDVHPIKRHFSDTGDHIAKPITGYIDIESDSRLPFSRKEEMRVLCWTLVHAVTGEVTWGMLEEDSDASEKVLLDALWKAAEQFDQLVAWNGDRFDFEVIKARSIKVKSEVKDFRRWLYLDHLLCYKRMNLNSSESGDQKQSFKLDDVATSLLGEGKEDFDAKYTWDFWKAGGEKRERLLRYNIKDTILLKRIEDKTGYLALFQTLCEVCRIFPESRSLQPTVQMDGFMLRLGYERGYHFPTKYFDEVPNDKYAGAYVMPPNAEGIVKNVHVGDFKSLYPSIILTWNMSPDTKGPRIATSNGELPPEGYCYTPATGQTFRKDENAILPLALKELLRLRVEWANKQKNLPPGTPEWYDASRRSTAYKVAANSFYGVVGSAYSRYYDRDIAESITQSGAWLIRETMKFAEKKGMRAIYGDTDSLFITGVNEPEFRAFVETCNRELYPKLTATAFHNSIVLDYEKEFERIVFTSAKRYCGRYKHYKGKPATDDSEPEVKGLEYKRGDTPVLARRFQKKVIDLLCKNRMEEPEAFLALVEKSRDWLLNATLPVEQVRISKSISKPLEEYASRAKLDGTSMADVSHVAIAKVLQARGEDIGQGTRVFYFVEDATTTPLTVKPIADYTGECDRYYLWEALVYPPTLRLLSKAFPAVSNRFDNLARARPRHRKVKPVPEEQLGLGLDTSLPPAVRLKPGIPAPFESKTHLTPNQAASPSKIETGTVSAGTNKKGRTTGAYVIRVNKNLSDDQKQEILSVLHNSAGKRGAEIHYHLASGIRVESLPVKIQVTLSLIAQIDEILKR